MIKVDTSKNLKPYEKGVKHGKETKSIIEKYLEVWEEKVLIELGHSLSTYSKIIDEENFFKNEIENYCPDLLEEVKGIANGSQISEQIIFCWQLLDEHYWLINNILNLNTKAEDEGCSTAGVKSTNSNFFVQNLDVPIIKDGCQTILTHETPLGQDIIFTQAGALASFGVNDHNIAIGVNALPQLNFKTEGLPVCFVIRKLLQCKSFEEANQMIQNIPHSTGHHYLIMDPKNIASWECSANKTIKLNKDFDFVTHTNHPLYTEDIFDKDLIKPGSTTKERLELLNNHLDSSQFHNVKEMENLFSQSPVCVNIQNSNVFTFFSVIIELTENKSPNIFFQSNPPLSSRYLRL